MARTKFYFERSWVLVEQPPEFRAVIERVFLYIRFWTQLFLDVSGRGAKSGSDVDCSYRHQGRDLARKLVPEGVQRLLSAGKKYIDQEAGVCEPVRGGCHDYLSIPCAAGLLHATKSEAHAVTGASVRRSPP